MAWENCEIANFVNSTLGDNLLSKITNYNQTQRIYDYSTSAPNASINNGFDSRTHSNNEIIFSDSEITLSIAKTGSGFISYGFSLTIENTKITTVSGVNANSGNYGVCSYAFVIDEANERAQFCLIQTYHENNTTAYTIDTSNMLNKGHVLYLYIKAHPSVVPITSNGGGATHIAKVTGQLSSLSNNLSDILMVSGGGGGGLIIGENVYAGKDAGGISGSGNNSANQTTGYAFGQGESADGVSGGGGGLYGGYSDDDINCVEEWTFNSVTKNLAIVNNADMIPSSIINGSPTGIAVIQSGGGSLPNYFISTGDVLYHNSQVTDETITFVDNEYLKIIFGKYQHPSDQRDYYGTQIIDKVRNVAILNFGTDTFSGQYYDHYFSIVIDESASRAYLILLEYVSTLNGYNVVVVGGKTDNTDLFWETFKTAVSSNIAGGAGSGYIGNTLVGNKKMVGYNVPTSSAESTKTESVNEASESPVSGKPKSGNGYARIKLVRELPDELILYNNGQVNTDFFDVNDVEIGQTEAEPISKNYEVKSNYLLLEYNNWQNTSFWRGIFVIFNGKTFPEIYTKIKLTMEVYAKYNGGWSGIEIGINGNSAILKNFNDGDGIRQISDTRYQFGGRSSDEATDEWVDTFDFSGNHIEIELSGVNAYHEASMKIKKITLLRE